MILWREISYEWGKIISEVPTLTCNIFNGNSLFGIVMQVIHLYSSPVNNWGLNVIKHTYTMAAIKYVLWALLCTAATTQLFSILLIYAVEPYAVEIELNCTPLMNWRKCELYIYIYITMNLHSVNTVSGIGTDIFTGNLFIQKFHSFRNSIYSFRKNSPGNLFIHKITSIHRSSTETSYV